MNLGEELMNEMQSGFESQHGLSSMNAQVAGMKRDKVISMDDNEIGKRKLKREKIHTNESFYNSRAHVNSYSYS